MKTEDYSDVASAIFEQEIKKNKGCLVVLENGINKGIALEEIDCFTHGMGVGLIVDELLPDFLSEEVKEKMMYDSFYSGKYLSDHNIVCVLTEGEYEIIFLPEQSTNIQIKTVIKKARDNINCFGIYKSGIIALDNGTKEEALSYLNEQVSIKKRLLYK